ncbi:MAG: hypothetical protein ACTSRP_05365 [Candidatus Helarchaeota archaeon]
MDKIILDACSLIYLTKISIKEVLLDNFKAVIIPNYVKKEVLYDTNLYKEAKIIEQNINNKKIKVKDIKIEITSKNLGKGELEAIELAIIENSLLITDDKLALTKCLLKNVSVKTSEVLLIDLLKRKIISYDEFKCKLNELNKIKTLKPDIFQFILKEGEKYK